NPQLEVQLCQEPLKPPGMPGGLHTHPHAASTQLLIAVKLLRCSVAMGQSLLATIPCLRIYKRNLLNARVIITSYKQHLRLLSPEPWLASSSLLSPSQPTLL